MPSGLHSIEAKLNRKCFDFSRIPFIANLTERIDSNASSLFICQRHFQRNQLHQLIANYVNKIVLFMCMHMAIDFRWICAVWLVMNRIWLIHLSEGNGIFPRWDKLCAIHAFWLRTVRCDRIISSLYIFVAVVHCLLTRWNVVSTIDSPTIVLNSSVNSLWWTKPNRWQWMHQHRSK